MTNIFEYNELKYEYEVFFTKNKNTYVKIKDNKVCVYLSKYNNSSQVHNILVSSNNFIISQLKKRSINSSIVEKNCELFLFGKKYQLLFLPDIKDYVINDKNILISKIYEKKDISIIKDYISKSELEKQIKLISKNLIEKAKLDFIPTFKVVKVKSYYGVCMSKKKLIKINLILSKTELKYLDFIICHELTHFYVHNHQREFYQVLTNLCPDHRRLFKELKEFYRNLSVEI